MTKGEDTAMTLPTKLRETHQRVSNGSVLWENRCGRCAEPWPCPSIQAAEELERLREVLGWHHDQGLDELVAERDRLRATIPALVEALEEIAGPSPDSRESFMHGDYTEQFHAAQTLARAALATYRAREGE